MTPVGEVALFLDPPSHHFDRDRLFDPRTAAFAGADLMRPYRALREALAERGIPVHTADRLEDTTLEAAGRPRKLFVSFGGVRRYGYLVPRSDVVLSAMFVMECPIVEPRIYRALASASRAFRRIFTWSDAEALRPFTRATLPLQRFHWPQSRDAVEPTLWVRRDRAFLVMINANKLPRLYVNELYTARLRAVEFFHRFGEIDLYGPNWQRMPNRVGTTWVPYTAKRGYRVFWEWRQRHWPNPLYAAAAAATRGPTPAKLETLSRYTFALCFENMVLRGWMTEKLFDCLFAGSVPVYWGAPDVAEWVSPECFIDMRRFADFAELRRFLHEQGPAEIDRFREAGRDYLTSTAFDRFRCGAFVDLFRGLVREDGGVEA